MTTPAALHVDVPRLEPSDALVAQLAGLAGAGAPVAAPAPAPAAWWSRPVGQVACAIVSVVLVVGAALALGQFGRGDQSPTRQPVATPGPTSTESGTPTPAPSTDVPDGSPRAHERASAADSPSLTLHQPAASTRAPVTAGDVRAGGPTAGPSDGSTVDDDAPTGGAAEHADEGPAGTPELEDEPGTDVATDDGGDDAG